MNTLTQSQRERFRFFADLSEQEGLDFLRFCATRTVPVRDILWQEGDPEKYAAFIVTVRLRLFSGRWLPLLFAAIPEHFAPGTSSADRGIPSLDPP